ncbi:GGDEF domain-containing protein [Celerinatantimonas diazotrophica]|uniref:diguanylate cyclase n=1 Tax=Celerinatantimonas diazotrophica TaxID=412034 RepID=A0A4R1KIQ3_9GAMM|nr:GGDEF domain-containing protein [Celerinatantimonas diazotrophica]TCK63309.1 diguanylate cyclase (GGDEF)-like protein [Celerinatantimonas diazotrophica]CAG9298453.1 hypothetical protein CEDIAZO_03658 [Celerinatantimonas diazotrophica]
MQTLLSSNDNTVLLSKKMFRSLVLLAMVGFAMIWAIDFYSAIIIRFDAVSYPICIVSLGVIFLLSYKISLNVLQHLGYFIIAGYLISSSIVHHELLPHQELSSAVQWLALNYVMAYLFFSRQRAVLLTIIVFVITMVGHFWVLSRYDSLDETFGMILNMAVAHIIYIILLWGIVSIREKAVYTNTLEQQVQLDPLTQLLNRRGFEKKITHFSQLKQSVSYALLILDVDHFKQINDTYGHLVGDQVLIGLSQKLREELRHNDIIARWGGEEFAVIIFYHSVGQVLKLAQRLRLSVEQMQIDNIAQITVSIGVGFSHEVSHIEQLFELVDTRLYNAKKAGRNCIIS